MPVPLHLTNEENEVQGRKVTEPRLLSEVESERGPPTAETFSTSVQEIKCTPLGLPYRHSPEKILQAHITASISSIITGSGQGCLERERSHLINQIPVFEPLNYTVI